MFGRIPRAIISALAAVTLTGSAVFAIASPSHAATVRPAHTTLATAKAAKAKGWWASGYTGKQLHGTWAGPDVGIIAWTVGLSMSTYKGSAYRSCRSNWTSVNIDVSWNSASLHNGAQLVIIDSVKLSNGKWRDVGPALTISSAAWWPGHPAFGGQYHAMVYTPGNVHVILGHIQSWISNDGVPYPDPTGSGDSVTLKQFRRC